MIKVENLIFDYPNKRVLKSLSFNIQSGSVTALVGPNGAGKTTLMRCISGLLPAYQGRILVGNVDVTQSPREVHRNLGYLSDFFGLYNDLTVTQCLQYNVRLQNIPAAQMADKIALAVQRVSLENYVNAKAGDLSRGLRQRLGIAQAIIHEPKVLLLDEPASGLDPEARIQLSELILSLKEQGATIIVSSHIISELEDYCSDMLLIRDGQIISHTESVEKLPIPTRQVEMQLTELASKHETAIRSIPELQNLIQKEQTVSATLSGDEKTCQEVLKKLVALNVPICSFTTHKKRLKDIYMDHRTDGVSL